MKRSVWIVTISENHHEGQTIIDSIWSSEEKAMAYLARLTDARSNHRGWGMSCDEYEVDPGDEERT